nr:reverse transcriptase domain-containing protein [Tanacetum cinerariifolium]
MANTTPLVTTVTKPVTNPRDADAAPRVNIQDFCEEYYEDILPIIMDKVRRDKRKEVHARLDFEEGSRERRTKEGSHYSSARTLSARPERLKVRDRLRYNDRHVLDQLAKKYVKDPVEIHNIKQKDGETIKDFMERFKVETMHMKGAPECMHISRFMHKVNNPKLTKRLNEHVPKTMEEMMITTTTFIRGEAVVASKKKGHTSCRTHDQLKRQTLKKRTPKEILAAEVGKFQPPLPMVTPVEKRSSNKFCDFHNDKGHIMDECMQLKNQIEELVRAGKLSHLIKEIKHERDQSKVEKKETPAKDKPAAIYMIQSWQRMTRQKVTQSFERVREITFPPLATSSGAEGPLVIEAEIGGHMIHRMYVDGGSSMEVLYEHCFNRLLPEVKNQMVPTTTSLTGFSGETIWPLGQLRLLVTIGDADHSTRAWMNFMIVRSLSPYNGIIGRPTIKEIQAVPSTAHEMLKFPADGGIVTICSINLIPAECAMVITSFEVPKEAGVRHENFKVSLHPNFPDQEVAIGGENFK